MKKLAVCTVGVALALLLLSPLLTDMIKKLTVTNRQTGAKETFTLKESKCF